MAPSNPFPKGTAPRFSITVGGTTYDEYQDVSRAVVDTTTEGADYFEFTAVPPFDFEAGEFDTSLSTFEPGAEVSISMGHGEGSGSTKEVISGAEVKHLKPEYPANQPPKIRVSGYGPLRELMTGTATNSWENTKIKSIVSGILMKKIGLPSTESANQKPSRVARKNENAYDFIKRLANRYGHEFFVYKGTPVFRPKNGGSSPDDPASTLSYAGGGSLQSLSLEETPPKLKKVKVKGWDAEREKEIVGTAQHYTGPASGTKIYRKSVSSRRKANKIADAKLPSGTVTCKGRTFGNANIVAGGVIEIKDIDSKYAGEYYVTDATHRVGEEYMTSFEGVKL